MNGLIRLRAPIAEDIVLLFSSICSVHERCSSINDMITHIFGGTARRGGNFNFVVIPGHFIRL